MSSAPHSPPKTPSKPTMAVGNENNPTSRTPLPDGVSKAASMKDEPSVKVKESPSQEIQVPSTNPHIDSDGLEDPEEEETQTGNRAQESPNISDDDETEEEDGFQQDERDSVDHSAELPALDWLKFQDEYTEALSQANAEEGELLAQFNKVVDVSVVPPFKFRCLTRLSVSLAGPKLLAIVMMRGH